jgi:plasmid stability protein
MTQLSIEIPDDLVRHLRGIAAAENKSVEQVASERLRSSMTGAGSPDAVRRAMKESPGLSSSSVDELEEAIARGRLPVDERGAFDRRSGK